MPALDAMQEVAADARLAEYQPYWAARAELLAKTARTAKLATRTKSQSVSSAMPAVRRFLQRRQSQV